MVASPAEPVRIDVTRHIKFARAIARGVRRDYRFLCGQQESWDLEGVALLELVKLARRFDPSFMSPGSDPDRLFQGWASQQIRKECQRESLRLRNGGTYNTTRRTQGLKMVRALPHPMRSARNDEKRGRAGEQLPTDGRRVPCPEPVDILIESEGGVSLPDAIAPDLLMALVLESDICPFPTVTPNRFTVKFFELVHRRRVLVRLLHNSGFSDDAIADLFEVSRATVRSDLHGFRRSSANK